MIALLRGNIITLSPNSLLIDVNGVGYNCIISLSTFNYLKDKNGKEITILTYHHINDTTQLLFAFHEQEERDVFKMLIGVSGVGPKTAIQFLSSSTASELEEKIKSGNVDALTSIPGIGSKTAKRIIIELMEKLTSKKNDNVPLDNTSLIESNYKDALDALLVLGYNKKDICKHINKIVSSNSDIATSDLIKKVLNKIGK